MGAEKCFVHVFTVGQQVVTARVRESSFQCLYTWEPGLPPSPASLPEAEHREYMRGMQVVEAHLQERAIARGWVR